MKSVVIHLAAAVYLLACPGIAMAGGCWDWAAKRLGSMAVDGGLAWSWALPAIGLPSGEAISIEVTMHSPRRYGWVWVTGTEVEWSIPQLTTCVAPRQRGRWAWRSPNGTTRLLRSPSVGTGLGMQIEPDGSGSITSPDGWRFSYHEGSLNSISSPKNVTLRVIAKGPKIQRIELGPTSQPNILIAAQYSRTSGALERLETPGGGYSFIEIAPGSLSAVVNDLGEELLGVAYADGVIDAIHVGGAGALPVKWKRLTWWQSFFVQGMTRRDFILETVGTERYHLDISGIATTITARDGKKARRMIHNNYTGEVSYFVYP